MPKFSLLAIGLLSLSGCMQMEWRGGMIPHVGMDRSEKNPVQTIANNQTDFRTIPSNWNQFRGPNRDGVSLVQGIKIKWNQKPDLFWKIPCGEGHSSVVVNENSVFTLEQNENEETLYARNFADGKEKWTFSIKTKWNDMMSGTGPRSTPTLYEEKVYALFSNGLLCSIDAKSGELNWKTKTIDENYEFPEWGISCSPLIWNDLLILNQGGEKSAAQAYDLRTGQLAWDSEFHGEGVYISPALLEFFGEKHLLVAIAGKVASLNPENGKLRWEHPWKIFLNNALISQPIQLGTDRILLSAGYGKGAECLQIEKTGDDYQLSTIWKSKDLKSKFSNPVLKDGFLYGFSENLLVCLNATSGDLQWRGKKYGYGRIIIAEDKLVILGNSGVLSVVEANPNQFYELQSEPLLSDVRCWNGPALAGGYFLAMNGQELGCFDWAQSP